MMAWPAIASTDFFPLPPNEHNNEQDGTDGYNCPLKCLHNSSCTVLLPNDPPMYEHELNSSAGWYCSCPSGYYGTLCENEAERCGDNFCYNGSKCLQLGLEEGYEYVCDCAPAYSEQRYWSGEFCQYPSTVFCTDAGVNGRQFCTNGGICPPNDHGSCICPENFTGPRCAFEIGKDGDSYAGCNLSCENGGTCQKGQKDLGTYGRFASELSSLITETHLNFEHCVCPPSYFGIRCEYEVELCKESEFCLHGGACEANDEGVPRCVCPPGYEGEHCESMSISDTGKQDKRILNNWLFISCIFVGCIVCVLLYRSRLKELIRTSSGNSVSDKISNVEDSGRCIGMSII